MCAKETKVTLYHTLVQNIVLYNAETWTLKEKHERKLRVFEMSVMRRICGITRHDRRRNVDIKGKLEIKLHGHSAAFTKTKIDIVITLDL